MFRLLRFLLSLAFVAGFLWFASTVELGHRTLFDHVRRIWHSEETQDLVEGAKRAAEPTIDRVKRGVKKGYEEARKEADEPQAKSAHRLGGRDRE